MAEPYACPRSFSGNCGSLAQCWEIAIAYRLKSINSSTTTASAKDLGSCKDCRRRAAESDHTSLPGSNAPGDGSTSALVRGIIRRRKYSNPCAHRGFSALTHERRCREHRREEWRDQARDRPSPAAERICYGARRRGSSFMRTRSAPGA